MRTGCLGEPWLSEVSVRSLRVFCEGCRHVIDVIGLLPTLVLFGDVSTDYLGRRAGKMFECDSVWRERITPLACVLPGVVVNQA